MKHLDLVDYLFLVGVLLLNIGLILVFGVDITLILLGLQLITAGLVGAIVKGQ